MDALEELHAQKVREALIALTLPMAIRNPHAAIKLRSFCVEADTSDLLAVHDAIIKMMEG